MNNKRRKQIDKVIKFLNSAINTIDDIKSEEEEYMDNMPENLQGSTRYSAAEDACGALEDAIFDIESAIENLETAQL